MVHSTRSAVPILAGLDRLDVSSEILLFTQIDSLCYGTQSTLLPQLLSLIGKKDSWQEGFEGRICK
jgi:hypothetical protein